MDWTEITARVPTDKTDEAAAIANMTVPYGIYIEDYTNLEADAEEIAHIDLIDDELVKLFVQRMDVAAKIADYKKSHDLPILVPAREREKLTEVAQIAGPEMANYTRVLYSMLFELSRSYQSKCNLQTSELHKQIVEAIDNTPKLFPQSPMVACQGVEGAYSQIACEKMFKNPMIMYFKNFDGIFNADRKSVV